MANTNESAMLAALLNLQETLTTGLTTVNSRLDRLETGSGQYFLVYPVWMLIFLEKGMKMRSVTKNCHLFHREYLPWFP